MGRILLLLVGAGYAIYFTPIPLQHLAKELNKEGILVRGIEGNLEEGLKIERIMLTTQDFKIDLLGVEITYGGIDLLMSDQVLSIDSISVNRGKIKLLKKPLQYLGLSGKSAPSPAASAKSILAKIPLAGVRIKMFDFRSLDFSYPGQKVPHSFKAAKEVPSNLERE